MKTLMIRTFTACLLALLLVATGARAARLNDLFQEEVDAAGRDAESRDVALQQALQSVLLRITGSAGQAGESTAEELLKQPGRFVEQYRYRQVPGPGPGAPERLRLWVQFDGVALEKGVRDLGLPFWGYERPDVLVWLAIDDRGSRYLVSEAAETDAAGSVLDAAARHGLPVTLPLMDLEDQRAVQFTDVWGGFVSSLESASQRYRPQVILLGKLGRSSSGGGWRGDWNLLGVASNQSWTSHANNLDMAVQQGIAEASAWLVQKYAVVAGDESVLSLVVEGITDLEDYARVQKYLASLTPVDRVQVAQVRQQEMEFNLKLNADERNLLQLIRLGKMLQPLDEPSSWRFRLNR